MTVNIKNYQTKILKKPQFRVSFYEDAPNLKQGYVHHNKIYKLIKHWSDNYWHHIDINKAIELAKKDLKPKDQKKVAQLVT